MVVKRLIYEVKQFCSSIIDMSERIDRKCTGTRRINVECDCVIVACYSVLMWVWHHVDLPVFKFYFTLRCGVDFHFVLTLTDRL